MKVWGRNGCGVFQKQKGGGCKPVGKQWERRLEGYPGQNGLSGEPW